MRFFNTSGPIVADAHYHVPPLSRLDVEEVLELVRQGRYFVLHAPRQTGKTTALGALLGLLNQSGRYRCVYVNVEPAQTAREDVGAAMQAILSLISHEAIHALEDQSLYDAWPDILQREGPQVALRRALAHWAASDPRPLVLLIDEIDSLVGDTLVSVLRQLFRENSEHWVERFQYREAGPQLLLQAFLQRVVNSGGRIEREYGVGRRRIGLAVIWPLPESATGAEARGARPEQRVVVECKLVRKGIDATVAEGLRQTVAYMDIWRASEGHLVTFDRTPDKPWEQKVFRRSAEIDGRLIAVWGM